MAAIEWKPGFSRSRPHGRWDNAVEVRERGRAAAFSRWI
jgi:hypothetical protein